MYTINWQMAIGQSCGRYIYIYTIWIEERVYTYVQHYTVYTYV